MDNETLFYVFGIALAASALILTFAGLRLSNVPGRFGPVIGIWFALLVVGVTTFAVLHAQDEHEHESPAVNEANVELEEREKGAQGEPEMNRSSLSEGSEGGKPSGYSHARM